MRHAALFVLPERCDGDRGPARQRTAQHDEAEIMVMVAKDATPQRQDMIVSGLMRANNQSIVRFARTIPVQIVAP